MYVGRVSCCPDRKEKCTAAIVDQNGTSLEFHLQDKKEKNLLQKSRFPRLLISVWNLSKLALAYSLFSERQTHRILWKCPSVETFPPWESVFCSDLPARPLEGTTLQYCVLLSEGHGWRWYSDIPHLAHRNRAEKECHISDVVTTLGMSLY